MNGKILWVDDEIDLLKPHIMMLQGKGYEVSTSNNGYDALDLIEKHPFDLIILDEMMPGMTGLETLSKIKDMRPTTPVVMVTKSEEENIMNKAIGSKIADYLIKPVHPNQLLLAVKKNLHSQQLVSETTTADYMSQFGGITSSLSSARTFADWVAIYRKLAGWDVELADTGDANINEVLLYQKNEANNEFCKFIKNNYLGFFDDRNPDKPILSHNLMRTKVFPIVDDTQKTTFLLIDNFRYDQWRAIHPILHNLFEVKEEDFYCAILPTATQYARNAIFAGLTPLDISRLMPSLWLHDHEEGGKNQHEEEFLARQIQSNGKKYRFTFDKLTRPETSRKLLENINKVDNTDLAVIVYNFLDILSHARTETDIIRELAENETSYRSLTRSWFEHSDLYEIMKRLAEKGHTIVISSDHGTKQVDNAIRVVGDRETSLNLRYKTGKNLKYNHKEVFEITNPEQARLPKSNLSSTFIFAMNSDFFAYPNNYNHYVRYYKNTFQHGGVSMEEMIVPFIVLKPK